MWPRWIADLPWRTIGALVVGVVGGGLAAVAVRRARGPGSAAAPHSPARVEGAPPERAPRTSGDNSVQETRDAPSPRRCLPRLGRQASTPESLADASALALLLFLVVTAVTALVSMTLPHSFPLFGPVASALLGVHVLALRDADRRRHAACASEPAAALHAQPQPPSVPTPRARSREEPGAPPAASPPPPTEPSAGEVSQEAEGVAHTHPSSRLLACLVTRLRPPALFAEVERDLDGGGDLRTTHLPRLQAIEADSGASAVRRSLLALEARDPAPRQRGAGRAAPPPG